MGAAWQKSPLTTELIPLPETGGMELVVRDLLARKDRPTVVAGPSTTPRRSWPRAASPASACRETSRCWPSPTSESERSAIRQDMASTLIDAAMIGRKAGEVMLAWLAGEPPEGAIEGADLPLESARDHWSAKG
jgi:hypothetical protein